VSRCPECQYRKTMVADSRPRDNWKIVFRRRRCTKCGHRFNTIESYEIAGGDVVGPAKRRAIAEARRALQSGIRALDELDNSDELASTSQFQNTGGSDE
jgi:transcriptional repressor NrdR